MKTIFNKKSNKVKANLPNLFLLLLSIFFLASFTVSCSKKSSERISQKWNEDWPISRYDNSLTANPGLPKKTPTIFNLLYKLQLDEPIFSPVCDGELLYIASGKKLLAIDLMTGDKQWEVPLKGTAEASPLIFKEMIIVTDSDGEVFAIDTQGKMLWNFKTKEKITGAPNANGDLILIPSYDSYVYALTETGSLAWRYKTESYVNGSVAVYASNIFITGCDKDLHIIDFQGKSLTKISAGSYVASSPAVNGGIAYVGNHSGKFLALSPEKGELWSYDTKNSFLSSAAVGENVIYATCQDMKIYAFERNTGKMLWFFQTGDSISGSPAVLGEGVLAPSDDGTIYLLDNKGKLIWSYNLGSPVLSPIYCKERVVLTTYDGSLSIFEALL